MENKNKKSKLTKSDIKMVDCYCIDCRAKGKRDRKTLQSGCTSCGGRLIQTK